MEFQEISPKISEMGNKMQSFFEEEHIKAISSSSGFIQRENKLTAPAFLQMCIEAPINKGHGHTLTELCTHLVGLGVVMCNQSLNEQFKKESVDFVKKIFEQLLLYHLLESAKQIDIFNEFSGIYLEDSTSFLLPTHLRNDFKGPGGTASDAMIKLNLLLDIKGHDSQITLSDGTRNDKTFLTDDIKENALYLRDLGYHKLEYFERINQANAFYVSRLKSCVYLYWNKDKKEQPIDLQSLIDGLEENQYLDIEVYAGQKKRIKTRLVIQKVPEEVAAKKRGKMKKDKRGNDRNVSQQRLDFCSCNAFITNLDQQQWQAHMIAAIYKIRWQIEIIFKVWKSIFKLGNVHKMKVERFLCLLYGHLIWILLNTKVFTIFKSEIWNTIREEISELKGFKILAIINDSLKMALRVNKIELYEEFLFNAYIALVKLGKKQYRKGRDNPLFHIGKFVT